MTVPYETVWAIDIGNSSLKALQLSAVGGVAGVVGFDNIQHGKILTGVGVKPAEKDELIAISLRRFLEQNDLTDSAIVISVPSQNSFARFVNLPPVEKKRIPEIVKFEAVQQIPFDIDDVQWDWQMMTKEDGAEKRVGIFAIKNEVVSSALEPFESEDIQVSTVQMAPMALYNYILYDRPELVGSDDKAVVVLNIGAENTDLVVCTKSTVWQRCILIGGSAFTRAIADTFKLNFQKAERLKRTAPVSKYARQIFQAMRPVFTDMASEVQRSLGFYSSSNPNTKIARIIVLGGGTKLRGLLKYLQQTLQIPVEKPDSFKRLAIGSGVSAAKFTENVCDFGIVYGLALQGLDMGRIESNLLPRSIARSMAWAGKARHFTIAAGLLLLISILCLARTGLDKVNYMRSNPVREEADGIVRQVTGASKKLSDEQEKGPIYAGIIQKQFEPFKYRELIPQLHETILKMLPNERTNPDQKQLYQAFAKGDVETILEIPREKRKQIFVTSMSIYYSDNLETAKLGSAARRKKASSMTEVVYDDSYGEYSEYERAELERLRDVMGDRYRRDTAGQQGPEKACGFVVTIAGYSPYEDIGQLLEPPGVEDTPSKWGFVTRLLHLDDFVEDANSPFEVYGKTSASHFKLDKDPVDVEVDMPGGIGVIEERVTSVGSTARQITRFLIDPLTKETISTVAVLDASGKEVVDPQTGETVKRENDYWFELNMKFKWRQAPGSSKSPVATAAAGRTRQSTSSSRAGSRTTRGGAGSSERRGTSSTRGRAMESLME